MEKVNFTIINRILVLFNAFVIIWLLTFGQGLYYANVYIPITNIILFFVFVGTEKIRMDNMVTIMTIYGLYTRNVLEPFFFELGNYVTSLPISRGENIKWAISLLCYDSLIIYIYLYLKNRIVVKKNERESGIFLSKGTYNILIFSIVFITTYLYVTSGSVRAGYRTIFSENIVAGIGREIKNSFVIGSRERVKITIQGTLMSPAEIFVGVWILQSGRTRGYIYKMMSAIIVIIFPLFFITDTLADVIFIELCFLLMIYYIYRENVDIKLVAPVLALIGLSIVLAMIYIKLTIYNTGEQWNEEISNMFCAYMPFVPSIAASRNIPKGFTFINEISYMIPGHQLLFEYRKPKLVTVFNSVNGIRSHIIPQVGYSAYYLGDVFSPVFSLCMISVSFRLQKKFRDTSEYFSKSFCMYALIRTLISIFCYNFSNWTLFCLGEILPVSILLALRSYELDNTIKESECA